MKAVFTLVGRLVLALAVFASVVFGQAQTQMKTQEPPKAAEDCAGLAEAKARLEAQEKRLRDWPDLARYRDANAKVAGRAEGEQRVVFMGDSITDLWVQPRIGGFFPGKPYIGRGISGQTTPQMLVRFRADVIALRPQVVVILAGTNDLAGNTGPITLEETEGNLASMAELAHANGIRVVLASVTPVSNYGRDREGNPLDMRIKRPPEKILELNAWIKKYAAENDHVYLDYFPAMVDEHGLLKKELSEDGLHPNAAGYAVMAPLAEKAIQAARGETAATDCSSCRGAPVIDDEEKEVLREFYGLYYADWEAQGGGETALVISPDGRPITKKENDPQAPTLPGLRTNGKYFKFLWSRISPGGFAFRTVNIDGTEYLFHGKFGREKVDVIPEVPYLAGLLAERRDSRVVRQKKVHFAHAVVL
jgi:lysophospholipase L1-like esterase